MKNYATKTTDVDSMIWEPEYNYVNITTEKVTYCYDSTKSLRVAYTICTIAFVACLFAICIFVGTYWNLTDAKALLWVVPFAVVNFFAFTIMINLTEDYSSLDEHNERQALTNIKQEYEKKFQETSQRVDSWRSSHVKEELARQFVENIITMDTLLESCKEYDTRTQYEIFQLVDRYKTQRGRRNR